MTLWFNSSAAFEQRAGGIGTHARGLANALAGRDGWTIVTRTPPSGSDRRSSARALGPAMPRAVWREAVLPVHLARHRPRAYVDPAFAAPPCGRGTTCVTVVPDATPFNQWKPPGRTRSLLLRRQVRDAFRRAIIVFTSEAVRREYAEMGFPVQGAPVVPLGVEPDVLLTAPVPAGSHALFIGSGHPRKNLALVRRACRRSGVELRTCGGPGDRELTAGELVAEIAGAGVLLVPSYYEGFSLPVIEARALGTPVICSDIPVHREVGAATTTHFVAADDEDGWAAAVSTVIREGTPRQRTWSRTWDHVADDLERVL